jgi:MFS family permease
MTARKTDMSDKARMLWAFAITSIALFIFIAPIAGLLSDKIGGRPIMAAGLALQGAGLAWIIGATWTLVQGGGTRACPRCRDELLFV